MILYILPLPLTESLGPRLLLWPSIIDIVIILEIYDEVETSIKINETILVFLVLIIFTTQLNSFIYKYKSAIEINNKYIDYIEEKNSDILYESRDISNMYYHLLPQNKEFEELYKEFYKINR